MNKIILPFLLLIAIISGCSDNVGDSSNPCGNISDFTVTQDNGIVTFNLITANPAAAYEIQVAANEVPIGSLHTMNNTTEEYTLAELEMEAGNSYVLYVRSICSNNSRSDWSNPKTLEVN